MLNFRKLLAIFAVAASIFVAAGCSSNQATVQDQGGVQTGVDQSQNGQPTDLSDLQTQPAQQSQAASYQNIDAAQAKQLIDAKSVQLIDVREEDEFRMGYIAGAKLIPLGQLTSRIGEIDKTKPVLVYCATGARSAEAAQVLVASGYTKVYNLASGVDGWTYGLTQN
ncbi:MAG: rhodanese-like domain-containing protein [Candidatus Aquicultor sp.]